MKSCFFLVIGVLLVDVLWAQDVAISCSIPAMIVCEPKNKDELSKSGKPFPDVDLLNRHCDEYLRAFKCLVDYEKECHQEGKSMFPTELTIHDVYSLVKDVCDKESSIGKGYREHVDCLNSNVDSLGTCEKNVKAVSEGFKEYLVREHGEMTTEEDDKVDCLITLMMYNCLSETVEETCGEGAKGTIQELLDRIPSNPICTAVNLIQVGERFGAYLGEEAEESRKK